MAKQTKIEQALSCPAGHAQKQARADRRGRCTQCGAGLVVVNYTTESEEEQ